MNLQHNELEKISQFVVNNYIYKDKEKIKDVIKQHILYHTLAVEYDKQGNVLAVCRWNINGDTAYILDLIISKDHRSKVFIKIILKKGLNIWKNIKYISFKRGVKYPDRELRKYSVSKFLGGNYGFNDH
jgi:hypothetical protein